MSDIELAVTRTKILESILEQSLGATGKGLHEKVSSVQDRLSETLVRKLRFIATIRNKIVHESAYQQMDDRSGFTRACDESEAELRALLTPASPGRGCIFLLLSGAGLLGVARSLSESLW
jgi:hypothetical protein